MVWGNDEQPLDAYGVKKDRDSTELDLQEAGLLGVGDGPSSPQRPSLAMSQQMPMTERPSFDMSAEISEI
jgi:hypothetical protein